MALYSSQNSENNYEELVRALDKARTFSLPKEIEYAEGFYLYKKGQIASSLETALVTTVACYLKQFSSKGTEL
jgi:UDP-3-O-acyl-N-acetylglucosamine deacetylase